MSDNVRALVDEVRRYRKAEQDKKAFRGCLALAGKAAWQLGVTFWWGPFAVMIAFGIVHGYASGVPALGFWEAFMVTIGCRFLLVGGRASTGTTEKKNDAGA